MDPTLPTAVPLARTLPDLVREFARSTPDATAMVCPQGHFSYRELAARVARAAGALRAAGVRRGSRVGLLLANRIEWLELCLAAGTLGATTVPFSTWSTKSELAFLIQDSGLAVIAAAATFGERDFRADLAALRGQAGWPATGWLLDADPVPGDGFVRYADALNAAEPVEALRPGDGASAFDTALILYTSGSTSAPKAVPLVQGLIVENGFNIGERMGLTGADRVLLASPLFWAYGSSNALPATFSHGATLVLLEKFEPGAAIEIIERERCTAFYSLPAMAVAIGQHPLYRRGRLASLRTGLTIGSVEDFFHQSEVLGALQLCNIYGSTETGGNCCVTWHHWPLERRARCQGPPLPGQQLRFVDEETGAVLPPGQVGQVEVRGYVTGGYLGASAEVNARTFTADGWYRSGDLGSINADGDFVFAGRSSEMIKRAGINVSPAEVEAVLRRHPSVFEVAVVGAPDAARDEVIVAFVVPKAGHDVDPAALRAHCAAELSKYKLPDRIEHCAALPLTVTGKLQRKELQRIAAEAAQAAAANPKAPTSR